MGIVKGLSRNNAHWYGGGGGDSGWSLGQKKRRRPLSLAEQLHGDTRNFFYNKEKGVVKIRSCPHILYRGRNYNPKKRPVIPVMLWKPHEPVYPRLIKTTINGLSIKETKEIWKRGLADMVPCILVTFENEQIVVWRGKDYEPRKDGYFLKDRESVDDIGGLCVGKEQQAILELLYLSRNDFNVEILTKISSLCLLLRLDIYDNNIRGPIPTQRTKQTHLLTLRLQNNALSGHVPDLSASLLNLTVQNVTNNELRSHVPDSMLTVLFGNHALSSVEPNTETTMIIVPAKQSSFPQTSSVTVPNNSRKKGLRVGVIVAIVVVACVAVLVAMSFAMAHCCTRGSTSGSVVGSETAKRKNGNSIRSEKMVYGNGGNLDRDSDGTNTEMERSKLVFFDRRNQFELEDLLRALTEMLEKGSLGTVYRVVLDDGCTVAVKRLKDANLCERNEFEQYVDGCIVDVVRKMPPLHGLKNAIQGVLRR
ncbi:Leucine-rich repeat receptor-like protein kinase PXC1 [Glycine max]|nr:Leucine-rich repeat receptor-like protein kinase PXC1 [Glycine max]